MWAVIRIQAHSAPECEVLGCAYEALEGLCWTLPDLRPCGRFAMVVLRHPSSSRNLELQEPVTRGFRHGRRSIRRDLEAIQMSIQSHGAILRFRYSRNVCEGLLSKKRLADNQAA